MKRNRLLTHLAYLLAGLLMVVSSSWAEQAGEKSGKALFEQHCSMCHPNGGNIINPAKTLETRTLEGNGIYNAADIIAILRKPGPGMTPFGKDIIPDDEAKKIADYILETF
jgi:cytochrome c6